MALGAVLHAAPARRHALPCCAVLWWLWRSNIPRLCLCLRVCLCARSKWHPDREPDAAKKKKAEEKFKLVAQAYEVGDGWGRVSGGARDGRRGGGTGRGDVKQLRWLVAPGVMMARRLPTSPPHTMGLPARRGASCMQ